MASEITKELLEELYIKRELTDNQIGKLLNLERASISTARRRLGIPTRKTLHQIVVPEVQKQLGLIGVSSHNVKINNKTETFDLLLDDGTRIQVLTANVKNNRFHYSLSSRKSNGMIESHLYEDSNKFRCRKRFEKTCDYIIFCGCERNVPVFYWVVPSCEVADRITLTIHMNKNIFDYDKYLDKWNTFVTKQVA